MNSFGIIFAVLFLVVLLVVGPIFTILALNALFGLGISLSLTNWMAMAWMHLMLGGAAHSS